MEFLLVFSITSANFTSFSVDKYLLLQYKGSMEREEILKKLNTLKEICVKYAKDRDDEYKECDKRYKGGESYYRTNSLATSKKITNYHLDFVLADSLISSIDPYLMEFEVSAGSPEDVDKVLIWQAVLDYLLDRKHKLAVRKKIALAIEDFIITGMFALKVGYNIKTEVSSDGEEIPIEENYIFKRVKPSKIYLPPQTDSLLTEDIPYFLEKIEMAPERVEEIWGVEIESDAQLDMGLDLEVGTGMKRELSLATIWKYTGDIGGKRNQWVYFTEKEILEIKDNPYDHGQPEYILAGNYNTRYRSVYPFGDIFHIKDLSADYNEYQDDLKSYTKRVAKAKFTRLGGKNAVNSEALKTPEHGIIVDIKQPNAIGIVPTPNLHPAAFKTPEIVKAQLEFNAGVVGTEQVLKQVGKATGQAIIEKASNKRINRKVNIIEDAVSRAVDLLLKTAMQFMPDEQIVRVSGSTLERLLRSRADYRNNLIRTGSGYFFKIRKGEIKGNPDVRIRAGSSVQTDKNARTQKFINVYELVKDDAEIQQQYPKLKEEILKMIFRSLEEKELDQVFGSVGQLPQVRQAVIPPAQSPVEPPASFAVGSTPTSTSTVAPSFTAGSGVQGNVQPRGVLDRIKSVIQRLRR